MSKQATLGVDGRSRIALRTAFSAGGLWSGASSLRAEPFLCAFVEHSWVDELGAAVDHAMTDRVNLPRALEERVHARSARVGDSLDVLAVDNLIIRVEKAQLERGRAGVDDGDPVEPH